MPHGIVWSIVGTANKTKRPKSVGTCKNKKIFLVTTSCVHRHAGTGSVRASGKDLCHDGSTPAPFSPTDGKCSESGVWLFFFIAPSAKRRLFHRIACGVLFAPACIFPLGTTDDERTVPLVLGWQSTAPLALRSNRVRANAVVNRLHE